MVGDVAVCSSRDMKLVVPPICIQLNQRVSVPMPAGEASSVVTNNETEIHFAKIPQGELAMKCHPQCFFVFFFHAHLLSSF